MKTSFLVVGMWFLLIAVVQAESLTFESGDERVNLIELYTSEGCSSCPPADEWVSEFKDDARLWNQIIPVAFHVDYWDRIGWPDRFAQAHFGDRQRLYAMADQVSTVYTPGMMLNGREWRGWFYRQPVHDPIQIVEEKSGVLRVEVKDDAITASYSPAVNESLQRARINVAILGFDLETEVDAGENQGLKLKHDFVVLAHQRIPMQQQANMHTVMTNLPMVKIDSSQQALVAWVDAAGDLTPVQATGGWLVK